MLSLRAIESRTERRRPFALDAKVLLEDVGPYPVSTVNVSHNGLCIISQRPLVIGRNYAIAVTVPDSPRRINAWGTVVYCDFESDGFYSGIRFQDMDAYSKACITDLLSHPDGIR